MRVSLLAVPILLLACAPRPAAVPAAAGGALVSPEEFFGHRLGEDRKLVRWNSIVDYFRILGRTSDRIEVTDLAPSTLGKPFLMAAISTPKNLREADRYREIARKIASGSGTGEEARLLAREGKSIVLFTCNLHSTEIGSSQTAPELAYELVKGKLELEDVIVLLMPSINPDGQEMICEWYDKHLGTEFEGGPMPWLYHVYAGHDNNRDFYFFNLKETRTVSEIYYRTWFPMVIVDHHQMGMTGPRMFVPPYDDPVSPRLDPMLSRWLNVFGTHAALELEAAGLRGVTHQRTFSSYWIGGSMRTPWWNNRVGILTETASVRIATPIDIDPSESTARDVKIVTPDPWPGGPWRLRDIMDYQLECSYSFIRTAADHKEALLLDSWSMAARAIEEGRRAGEEVHVTGGDRGARAELARILDQFAVEYVRDDEGIHIPLDKPYARLLLEVFGKQTYPPGDQPYDVTAWTLSWLLGLTHEFRDRACVPSFKGEHRTRKRLDPRDTWSFALANRALSKGEEVYRAADGAFFIGERPDPEARRLRPVRLGMYKPWRASMDEGWTRLILERFSFPHKSIDNDRMKKGSLASEFDCIILPDISPSSIIGGRSSGNRAPVMPPDYQGGIGSKGVEALKKFVRAGGTLLCFDSACDLAIEKFGLPVRNVLKNADGFSCPGSILKARVDRSHPLALGMPEETPIFFARSPALQTSVPYRADIGRKVVVRYEEDESPLLSGYLEKPEKIQGRAALVDVTWGDGRVVLYAFRPQHRAQTWATYKLIFNAILLSATE